jgi:uncharacterized protein (DUF2336 family)
MPAARPDRVFDMTPDAKLLIEQFDTALTRVPTAEHLAIQRKVTDLFLGGVHSYSDRQIAIFNDLMSSLIERVDRRALLEMSGRLAAVDQVPADVVGRLSWSDDIAVAGPVLEKSNRLTDDALVGIAKAKSQEHLLAIAGRVRISEVVTDVLVERGNGNVALKVVGNAGAQLSELSFVKVVHEARGNRALAAGLATRTDVPAELQPFLKIALA